VEGRSTVRKGRTHPAKAGAEEELPLVAPKAAVGEAAVDDLHLGEEDGVDPFGRRPALERLVVRARAVADVLQLVGRTGELLGVVAAPCRLDGS